MGKTTIQSTRLARLGKLTLHHGGHTNFREGHCALEVVAWLAGEKHSDRPNCACPVVAAFVRRWNDRLPSDADRNQYIRPLLPIMVGSRASRAIEKARGWMAADWAIRVQAPAVLRLAGLDEHAAKLEALDEVTETTIAAARPVISDARSAAWAARAAKWPAWRAKFVEAFKAELKKRGVGKAVADADAVAAADAVVVADAAAVADAVADADAGSDRYWVIRNAVYAKLRELHKERFASIFASSNERAVELVKRMCALTEKSDANAAE